MAEEPTLNNVIGLTSNRMTVFCVKTTFVHRPIAKENKGHTVV